MKLDKTDEFFIIIIILIISGLWLVFPQYQIIRGTEITYTIGWKNIIGLVVFPISLLFIMNKYIPKKYLFL